MARMSLRRFIVLGRVVIWWPALPQEKRMRGWEISACFTAMIEKWGRIRVMHCGAHGA